MFIELFFINMFIKTHFILASKSKSRKFILKSNNLNFKQKKPTCDESFYKKNLLKKKTNPSEISLELSKIKALSVSNKVKNRLVVASDTTINFKGKLINKANSYKQAKQTIKNFSGKSHTINTSAAAYFNGKLLWKKTEKVIVKIRHLTEPEINNYIKKTGKSLFETTGCYQIEKNGPTIIESIKGDFFSVMGFPLFSFLVFLKKFNSVAK